MEDFFVLFFVKTSVLMPLVKICRNQPFEFLWCSDLKFQCLINLNSQEEQFEKLSILLLLLLSIISVSCFNCNRFRPWDTLNSSYFEVAQNGVRHGQWNPGYKTDDPPVTATDTNLHKFTELAPNMDPQSRREGGTWLITYIPDSSLKNIANQGEPSLYLLY